MLIIGCIAGIIGASWAFISSELGLLSEIEGQSPFRCRDLTSSGSDDEVLLLLLWLLGISALIRLTLAARPIYLSERLLFCAISIISGFFIFVLPDCGNVIFTAWHTMDIALFLALSLWLITGFLYLFAKR